MTYATFLAIRPFSPDRFQALCLSCARAVYTTSPFRSYHPAGFGHRVSALLAWFQENTRRRAGGSGFGPPLASCSRCWRLIEEGAPPANPALPLPASPALAQSDHPLVWPRSTRHARPGGSIAPVSRPCHKHTSPRATQCGAFLAARAFFSVSHSRTTLHHAGEAWSYIQKLGQVRRRSEAAPRCTALTCSRA